MLHGLWYGRRSDTHRAVLGKRFLLAAWIIVIGAYIHPPHGMGIQFCWMKRLTGADCPGCGLTRSISCAARGLFQQSWEYHPFGMVLWTVFLLVVVTSLLQRTNVLAEPDRRVPVSDRLIKVIYGLFVAAFLGYGICRAVLLGQSV